MELVGYVIQLHTEAVESGKVLRICHVVNINKQTGILLVHLSLNMIIITSRLTKVIYHNKLLVPYDSKT